MSLRRKLLGLFILPVLLCTTVAVTISALKIRKQGIEGLEDKSSAMLSLNIKEWVIHHQDGTSIINKNRDVAQENDSYTQNFQFRISSPDPINPRDRSKPKDQKFIDRFQKEKIDQIVNIDQATDSLSVMVPVFMEKSKGCLECHSSKQSEIDGDNTLRGIFIITSPMADTQAQARSAILQISIIGSIIMLVAIILGFFIVVRILSPLNKSM